MPMLRGGDDHALHILVVQDKAHVRDAAGWAGLGFGQVLDQAGAAVFVDVADVLERSVFDLGKTGGVRTAPSTRSDESEDDFFVGGLTARADSGERCTRIGSSQASGAHRR